jgi:hypothetical protein
MKRLMEDKMLRDYRQCRYNHHDHSGTHIHAPLDGPAIAHLDVQSEDEAAQLMETYAASHDAFEPEAFEEVVRAWKSASRSA